MTPPTPTPAGSPRQDGDPAESFWADAATVPNAITLVRFLCIPVFVWLLFSRGDRGGAAWLLAALGSTDWVDGWFARRFDQVSRFGKLFDPTVDRLMFLVSIPSIVIDGSMPLWVAVAILGREVAVSVIAVFLQARGIEAMDVTFAGKTGAFLLMFSVPMFLGAASTLSYAGLLDVLKWLFFVPGVTAAWYSLVGQYIPEARRRLAVESRVGSGA
ncbi:MAG: CDP-alcohol phosphatidyltransferase family protein [Acidimicrobiales bacterium]